MSQLDGYTVDSVVVLGYLVANYPELGAHFIAELALLGYVCYGGLASGPGLGLS